MKYKTQARGVLGEMERKCGCRRDCRGTLGKTLQGEQRQGAVFFVWFGLVWLHTICMFERVQFLKLTLKLSLDNRVQLVTDLDREIIVHEDTS